MSTKFTFANILIPTNTPPITSSEVVLNAADLAKLEHEYVEFQVSDQSIQDGIIIDFVGLITELTISLITLDEMFAPIMSISPPELTSDQLEEAFAIGFQEHIIPQLKDKYFINADILCEFTFDVGHGNMRLTPKNKFTSQLLKAVGRTLSRLDLNGINSTH